MSSAEIWHCQGNFSETSTAQFANDDTGHFSRPTTFPNELERIIVDYLEIDMDTMLFGFNRCDLTSLAFQLAEENTISHVFNTEKTAAGKHWYYDFMRRHPDLSLRQPEASSLARAKGFNRKSVGEFFNLHEQTIDKYGIDGTRVYTMDESGLTTVQKLGKVISCRGKKQVGGITSGERGLNTTIVCCLSAAAHYVPPMVIFKRKRIIPILQDGAPEGSMVVNNQSGWMQKDLFLQWIKHFHASVNSMKVKHVLLILDGHASHTNNRTISKQSTSHATMAYLCCRYLPIQHTGCNH